MKKVQDKWKSEGKDIAIWYTLPILPTGLTPEGMNVLSDAKAKGVELAGVNVMTMDYGNAICRLQIPKARTFTVSVQRLRLPTCIHN